MGNKQMFLIFLILAGILLSGCSSSNDSTAEIDNTNSSEVSKEEKSTYEDNIKSLMKISPDELEKKLERSKDATFYVYFGRATCPYCREFVKDLKYYTLNKENMVYYIDTENTDIDSSIQRIRKEYQVEYVPTFIKFEKKVSSVFNSDEENLSEFMKQ
ncbi:hypothetical protein [Enterococcus casseliflavus]|uniref:hypothetical protein n=1 Tax=Enterococcus casseliflavus TaxID=37734 RepID=UPI0039A598A7